MGEFKAIFKKVNGRQMLKNYAKSHVLFHALMCTAIEGTSRKSLEIVRLSIENRMLKKLRKSSSLLIEKLKKEYNVDNEGSKPKIIWTCWFQGIENAPEIVHTCYKSLDKLSDFEVRLITDSNFREYVTLPDYIIEKHNAGIISQAHFADLIRLELLINYGGTWMDSTVLCTSSVMPEYIFKSDLFVYRILKPGLDGHSSSISNWLISAKSNNRILKLTRDLLYNYWRNHDYLIDYYIFHLYFELAMEAFPDDARKIPPCSSEAPHILLLRMFEEYDELIWETALNQTCFHKLTYKIDPNDKLKEKTFYKHIINEGEK